MRQPLNRVYFENAAGRLEEDLAGYARLIYLPGRREQTAWHGLLQHTARLLARQGHGLLLVDQRQMSPFTPEEQAWLTGQWLPRTIVEGGYRYGAIVQAQDVFARLAMDTVRMQAQDLRLTYRYFPDEAGASTWLLSHK